jgi:hypothetical protein
MGTFSLGPLGHDPDYPIRKGYGLEGPFQLGFEYTNSLRDPRGSSDDADYSFDTGRQLLTRRPAAADVTPAKTAVAASSNKAEGTASAKTGVAVAQYQGYDYGDDDLKEWPQTGLLACVNCSAVLGDRDAITLEPGADSPRDCICSPGEVPDGPLPMEQCSEQRQRSDNADLLLTAHCRLPPCHHRSTFSGTARYLCLCNCWHSNIPGSDVADARLSSWSVQQAEPWSPPLFSVPTMTLQYTRRGE